MEKKEADKSGLGQAQRVIIINGFLNSDCKNYLKANQQHFSSFFSIVNVFYEFSFDNSFLLKIPNKINLSADLNFTNKISNYLSLCGEFSQLTFVSQDKSSSDLLE